MATAQVAPVARNFKVGATALAVAPTCLNRLPQRTSVRWFWGPHSIRSLA